MCIFIGELPYFVDKFYPWNFGLRKVTQRFTVQKRDTLRFMRYL